MAFKKYTNEEIIDNLHLVTNDLGYTPSSKEYEKHKLHLCALNTIYENFGSWKQAIKMAGLKTKPIRHIYFSRELIENLKLVGNQIGHTPTAAEYKQHPDHKFSIRCFYEKFKSWPTACKKAGFKQSYRAYSDAMTKEQVIQNITNIIKECGYLPSSQKIKKHPKYKVSSYIIRKFFNSYDEMAKEFDAPIIKKDIISNKDLLDDLYHASLQHPNCSLSIITDKYTIHSQALYSQRFKNWDNLIKLMYQKYGIKIIKRDNEFKSRLWTPQRIQKYFLFVKEKLNKIPTQRELKEYAPSSITTMIRRFYKNYGNFLLSMGYTAPRCKMNAKNINRFRKIYINELKRITEEAEKQHKRITVEEIYTHSDMIYERRMYKIFGSAKEWFKAANVPYHRIIPHISEKEIISYLQNMSKKIGHVPTEKECRYYTPRICSSATICNRFGSWNKALIAAGLKEA